MLAHDGWGHLFGTSFFGVYAEFAVWAVIVKLF